ncbi:MAG: TetR/AcrR family transcriptional regulator [Anaerolineaceae bacterium]|nr:TetR/AcrR family transcriptional regulator [Anaerolineaceae bacterium]
MAEQAKSEMRNHILKTAAGLFAVQGYERISMREIAEACQISKAGLYYHYKDKEDLFLAVLYDHLSRYEKLLTEIRSKSESARDSISKFIRAVFTQLPIDDRSIFRLAQQDLVSIDQVSRAAFNQRYYDKFLTPIAEIIETGVSTNQIKAIDSHLGVWGLLGLMFPFFFAKFDNHSEDVEKIIDLIEMIFFDGIEFRPA